jgi:hypothetical protein
VADDAIPETLDTETTDKSFEQSTTDKVDATVLPGYEIGLTYGKSLGFNKGVDYAIEAFKLAQIESGTDAGVAFMLAQGLKRWIYQNKHKLEIVKL